MRIERVRAMPETGKICSLYVETGLEVACVMGARVEGSRAPFQDEITMTFSFVQKLQAFHMDWRGVGMLLSVLLPAMIFMSG